MGLMCGPKVEDKFLKLGRMFSHVRTEKIWWESDGTSMSLHFPYLGPSCKLVGVQVRSLDWSFFDLEPNCKTHPKSSNSSTLGHQTRKLEPTLCVATKPIRESKNKCAQFNLLMRSW